MKSYQLELMKGGWFIGNFEPSIFQCDNFEIAVKEYLSGDSEQRHVHKIAIEFTVIIRGEVLMNGVHYSSGDIIEVRSGESTDFQVLQDTITVVVKIPSVKNDKYILNEV